MSCLSGKARSHYVQGMFARIARRYDLLNCLMTLGRDQGWRREAISKLDIRAKAIVADLGCGTGDIAFEIARQQPGAMVIASDFTPEMVAVGRLRRDAPRVQWLLADAQKLPFAAGCLDAVISGFLLRNVPDVSTALDEQHRVLKEGGQVAALDTTPPQPGLLKPVIGFHLNHVIPLLGRFIAGDGAAYEYLPDSTLGFLGAEKLTEQFRSAGFQSVSFVRRMLGTIAIHWGEKTL